MQSIRGLLHALHGPAEEFGEWAFYALAVLLVLALWQRFPYRRFIQSHRLLPLVSLVLVFHSVLLISDSSRAQPAGLMAAALMVAASVAALIVLFGAVGRSRQALAVVEAIGLPAGDDVLKGAVRLQGRWPGHEAGRFACVRFQVSQGALPFSITSPWTGDGHMVFLIKGLGDCTRRLPTPRKLGDRLRVEGPYGRFNFDGDKRRQVWVGGGIGITPFIARLQQLAVHPDGKTIDPFYTTATPRDGAVARLTAAARAVRAKLHGMVEVVDGRLNAERLFAAVPAWRSADVWCCGPANFGKCLRHDLLAKGLAGRDFHQELFHMR